ncbi:hypothetical protein KVH27_14090 [Streptomyces olivaceus]|uniref:hypothetical protein n=1 Tax=Streptomyces olivaceus TaxID=47716 RepID=UPI001CCC17ED|nr:hypothetical protein [Streptomyces olivaceus]MBZ6249520.1 hypothetical protein [Streptomyces olivaceus]
MPLLFLNEKSWKTACDPTRAERAMADFVDAVRAVAAEDASGTAVVSELPLKSLEIADGYSISKWIGSSPRNHVRWQRLRALQNRSPVRSVLPTEDATDHLEYRHQDTVVHGLGAAHFMDGLGLSLPVSSQWHAHLLSLNRGRMIELDDGSLELAYDTVGVRHLSSTSHVDEHRAWIRQSRLHAVTTGRHIWERRSDLYPHLDFLPRTEGQLTELGPHWVVPVRRCLERLEEAVAAWDPAVMPEPEWRTKVTPEGETRKRVCWFTDPDGGEHCYDLHARFTPGRGRIHFRLLPQGRAVRLAHIGGKIRPDL